MRCALIVILCLSCVLAAAAEDGFDVFSAPAERQRGVRLKDLCAIAGVRDNQLHGIGIVVGLAGSGDSNAATVRMLRQLLAKKQLNFSDSDLASSNVAMVAVTADLPPFANNGARLPTQVSCIGDATDLQGGILLQTPLVAADERIYAVAQGPLTIGGFGDAGPGLVATGRGHQNVTTVAVLAEGALVEREVPVTLLYGDELRLHLQDPDFTTANKVALALANRFGAERVIARDAAVVALRFPVRPSEEELVRTIAALEHLRVEPDAVARVVINARTGTVVVGREVRIAQAAVSHGGLSLQVIPRTRTRPDPADTKKLITERVWEVPGATPEPLTAPPEGVVVSDVVGSLGVIEGVSVEEIANALNAMGARPRDLVAIFQALHRAGSLHAELVVM